MSQYDAIVRESAQAPSLEAIRKIVDAYPAAASREDGALYSGKVGSVHSGDFVAEVRTTSEIPLIDRTPRAELLSDPDVAAAIRGRSRALFEAHGVAPSQRQGAIRRPALRRNGSLGARSLRCCVHAARAADGEVRRRRGSRENVRSDRQGRERARAGRARINRSRSTSRC
jgi:hypothetical protein